MPRSDKLPPLGPLRTFMCVARHGSIARATRELNLSVSAVSQAIKKLEGWYGTPLMVREPQGVALLPDGELLRDACDGAFELLSSASAKILNHADRSPVVFSAPPSVMSCRLQGVLSSLLERHPDLALEVSTHAGPIDFRYDSVDLAIRYAANGAGRYHDATLLARDRIRPLISPSLMGSGEAFDPELLATHRLIHHDSPEMDAPGLWKRWSAAHGFERRPCQGPPDVRVDDFSIAADLAANGRGIVMGQAMLADRWVRTGRLVPLFPMLDDLELDGGWYLLHRSEHAIGPPALRVRNFLVSTLADDRQAAEAPVRATVARLTPDESVRTTSTSPTILPVSTPPSAHRRTGRSG